MRSAHGLARGRSGAAQARGIVGDPGSRAGAEDDGAAGRSRYEPVRGDAVPGDFVRKRPARGPPNGRCSRDPITSARRPRSPPPRTVPRPEPASARPGGPPPACPASATTGCSAPPGRSRPPRRQEVRVRVRAGSTDPPGGTDTPRRSLPAPDQSGTDGWATVGETIQTAESGASVARGRSLNSTGNIPRVGYQADAVLGAPRSVARRPGRNHHHDVEPAGALPDRTQQRKSRSVRCSRPRRRPAMYACRR